MIKCSAQWGDIIEVDEKTILGSCPTNSWEGQFIPHKMRPLDWYDQ